MAKLRFGSSIKNLSKSKYKYRELSGELRKSDVFVPEKVLICFI